jgi:hypothetical protein
MSADGGNIAQGFKDMAPRPGTHHSPPRIIALGTLEHGPSLARHTSADALAITKHTVILASHAL